MIEVVGQIQVIHEENNMYGVHWVIYLFLCIFVCGKFTQYGQHHLLLLIRNVEKAKMGLVYENYSLRPLRSKVVQTPELIVIPSSTVWRIRHLKLHRKQKRGSQGSVYRE